jgi:hypothetical protein
LETYFVATDKTGGFLGHFTIEQITKGLINAEILGDYFVTKSFGNSFNDTIKSGTAQWITVKELLTSQQKLPVINPPLISESRKRKCPYCAEEISIDAVKCKHCGEFLTGDLRAESQTTKLGAPTPTALILTVWILVVLQFFPMGQVSLIIDVAILICIVFLFTSKNTAANITGILAIITWLIGFGIGFFNVYSRRF